MSVKVSLTDAYKTFTLDQDKVISPVETVARFRKRLAEVNADILKETVRIDNGRLDIPVFFSYCGKDAEKIIGTRKQMGKGATPEQSEASAVMELAERFSFFSFKQNPANFFRAAFNEISENRIPFESIRKSVHDETEDVDAAREIFENIPLYWTKAFNMTHQREMTIPFDWFYAINEFNGPCAGNCVEEALSQGICEVVERHVSSVISHQRLSVPSIDPETATDEKVVEMIEKYRKAGVQLHISDFSLDTGIPSVGVLAYDPGTFPEKSEIVWTAGTTPDPEKALSRALTEVAQLAGDFNTGSNYVASGLPKFNTLDEADFICGVKETRRITDLPDLSDNNIRIEVENLVSALSERNFEVIVVDTKHPKLQIPAFYTIVPGAHFRERALGTSVGMFSAKLIVQNLSTEKALSELIEMEKRLPGKYYTSFFIGLCRIEMGQFDPAIQSLSQALDRGPVREDMASIYSYMGVAYKAVERYGKALEAVNRGIEFDASRTDLHNLAGFCHFKLKQHEEAIRCFRKVLSLDPGSAIDYANIAVNYRALGKKEDAVEYFSKAVAIDPNLEFAVDALRELSRTIRK